MKRALILGSSGFIGGHLVKTLIEENYYVVGADIRNLTYEIFSPSEFKLGDLRNNDFVEYLFKLYSYDEVYQLAADMGGATYINSGISDGSVMSNSVMINSNVAKYASKYNVGKLFFSSSACVYSNNDNIAECYEENVYPAYPDNEYGWEKLFSERMYKAFEKQYGLNVYIARFHSIIGEYSSYDNNRSKAHSALAYKFAMAEENDTIEVIGDGTQIRTFLHINDCIKGIRALIKSNCKQIVNIGSDCCISINQYLDILKKISGKNINIKYIDGPTGVKYRYCKIDMIKNECGWYPKINIEEATSLTYNFIIDDINKKKQIIGFISQKIGYSSQQNSSFCGIGIRGKLTSDILTKMKSKKYNFISAFIDSNIELEEFILKYKPKIIIYNYNCITTPYLNDPYLRNKYNNIIHVMIHYDLLQQHIDNFNPENFNWFKHIITDNDKLICKPNSNDVFIIARSIPFIDNIKYIPYNENDIPIIGFQGFGFQYKGITRLANKIQEEFDEACFRLHMPYSYYVDKDGSLSHEIISEIKQIIKKPGIKIEVSNNFLSDEEIIKWLNNNTINCYFYDYRENCGIASSPDYAIAAMKPIAINNSRMFVNLHGLQPSIEIEKMSLKDIIKNGIKPLLPIYEKYSNKNVLLSYEKMCDKLLD